MQDTSTNLSKLQREHLLDICSKIKKQEPVEIMEIAELEQFIKSMKYGLNFEKHEEPVDRMLRTHIPVFKEFKEVINNPESADCNFLLEGDNLHSLKLLEKTHKGRIDVCYIDPPYNTLNADFTYGDKMLDEEDGYKHSKWCSFIKERLIIARSLLSKCGIILISLDEHEQAQCKILCDEIFGEENLVSIFIRKTSSGEKTAKPKINKHHEYCLCYCRDIATLIKEDIIHGPEKSFSEYSNPDNDPNGPWKKDSYLIKIDSGRFGHARYPITNPYLGITHYPPVHYNEKERKQWHYVESTFKDMVQKGQVVFYKTFEEMGNSKYSFFIKKYQDSISSKYSNISSLTFTDSQYTNNNGTKDLKNILGNSVNIMGMYPKPVVFIKDLLKMYDKKDSIILDFFAGTGTTGQAVIEINKEDGGTRKFILCTNNEVGKNFQKEIKKNEITANSKSWEFNGICQYFTFPRLNTVITGIRPDGTKYSDGIKTNLRYFQTDMVSKNDDDLDELLYEASFCLAELDCMSRIDGKTICIAECDEDVDDIIQNATDDLKIVFVAYDVFFDAEQQDFFDHHHIEIKRIPDCYYTEY